MAGGGQHADVGPSPRANPSGDGWAEDLENFVRGRVNRVQTAAQFWLGTMTTLLGLFSALIVFNGGQSLAELPVGTPVRIVLYVATVTVYCCAFGAVVLGARATFGGLTLAQGDEPATRTPLRWVASKWSPDSMDDPTDFGWREFREHQMARADRLRTHLHRSRALGVLAILLAGLLALVVLAVGAFADQPADRTYVVVVHDGEVSCGAIGISNSGRTTIGGRVVEGVRQLVPVAHC